jgi:hypothetical protein
VSGVKRQMVQKHDILHLTYFSCKSAEKTEPTSGLEPLTCSLRVIGHVLLGVARVCKSRISKPLSFLRLALCCTVLRSRWYQSGINSVLVFA